MQTIDVLFACELGAGLNHIGRLRPLAEAFVKRGKIVAFAVRDVRHCEAVFAGTSFPWYQAPIKISPPRNQIREPRSFWEILHNIGFGDAVELKALVLAWQNLYQALNPQLVICELSPTALLALRGSPIRSVVAGTGVLP